MSDVQNYRRKAARTVAESGSRGAAYVKGGKSRLRAEAFEEALAIVSGRLAIVAHEQSEILKEERLARARAGMGTGPSAPPAADEGVGPGAQRTHTKTLGGVKKDASTRAMGARRQAKKDSKNAG